MMYPYQYAVLRYMHDAVTQEFVNIGVLLFSPETDFLDIKISRKYKRISQLFDGLDTFSSIYQKARTSVEKAVYRVANQLEQRTFWDSRTSSLEELLPRILPENDGALFFSPINGGVTKNLEEELDQLFSRFVEYYLPKNRKKSRTDAEIWNKFAETFRKNNILPYLEEVTIPTATFSYKFEHAFKNERWHPIEAVSFDLSEQTYIEDKANKWIGRAVTLATSEQIGTLFILCGKPNNPHLIEAYENARRGLEKNTQGIEVKVIDENEAAVFSKEFESFIKSHSEN